ncbi:hypothetical protein FB451DRAFT_1531937 [Mycena latifolia]|nr:hypothetical protein FB451DRAFT_1531937 [Mycena latifolia]
MNLLIALLVPFVAIAVANPVDATARDADINARAKCEIFGLICSGSPDPSDACSALPFECPTKGLPPISSDPICAANCICPC